MLRSKSALFVVLSLGLGVAACREEPAVGEERNVGANTARQDATAAPGATGRTGPSTSLLGGDAGSQGTPMGTGAQATPLEFPIKAASGSDVSGTARLTEEKDGVRVVVEFMKAPPGKHGLHFHEKGDCSDPKAMSAGGHFQLPGQKHGIPEGGSHEARNEKTQLHVGDLGNIEIGKDGKGKLEHLIKGATLKAGDPTSLRDRALILHAKEDKGTQPSGDSGDRIGCGAPAVTDALGAPGTGQQGANLGLVPDKSPHTTPGAVKPENADPVLPGSQGYGTAPGDKTNAGDPGKR